MASKVEGMEKLKMFHFKLMERLDFKLSYSFTQFYIRPLVQLALRANFAQLLQSHLFVQC